jgi:DNA-binding GntR family transcriptional regulator
MRKRVATSTTSVIKSIIDNLAPRFRPVRQGSIKTRVAEAVRDAIYAGRLRPGDPLLEMQLARDFRVSQTSIREALIQLEQLGLVRRFPNKGTQVTELSSREVRERLEIRIRLESLAAMQAAPHVKQRDAEKLRQLADLIGSARSRGDYAGSAQADLQFHSTIWTLSGNETLSQILHQVSAPMFAFISIVRSLQHGDHGAILNSHREIVDALLSHDPAMLQATIDNHFPGSYEEFLRADASRDPSQNSSGSGLLHL